MIKYQFKQVDVAITVVKREAERSKSEILLVCAHSFFVNESHSDGGIC